MTTLCFLILAFIAEILGTIGGFGSSLFFVPIAAYFFDFHSVLGITAVFHVFSNISKISLFRSGVNRKLILSMGIPAVMSVIAGAYLSKYLKSEMLETGMAVFLICISLVFLLMKKIFIQPDAKSAIAGGLISGFIAGLMGTGGAIRGIVLTAFGLSAEVFIATSAFIDFGIDLSRSIVYYTNGFIHREDMYLIPFLIVVSFAGTLTGKLILKHVTEDQFKTLVMVLVFLTGCFSMYKVVMM